MGQPLVSGGKTRAPGNLLSSSQCGPGTRSILANEPSSKQVRRPEGWLCLSLPHQGSTLCSKGVGTDSVS